MSTPGSRDHQIFSSKEGSAASNTSQSIGPESYGGDQEFANASPIQLWKRDGNERDTAPKANDHKLQSKQQPQSNQKTANTRRLIKWTKDEIRAVKVSLYNHRRLLLGKGRFPKKLCRAVLADNNNKFPERGRSMQSIYRIIWNKTCDKALREFVDTLNKQNEAEIVGRTMRRANGETFVARFKKR